MKRFLPTTLSGRLIFTLLIGLLAAQLAGSAILLRDRASVIYQASGLGAAQRIAGIVQVLDQLKPDLRATLLPALNSPQLRVSLVSAPLPLDTSDDKHAQHLKSVLTRLLHEGRSIQVALVEPIPESGEHRSRYKRHPHFGTMANYFPRHNVAFEVQLQLADGSWAHFDYGLGGETFAWPWRLLPSQCWRKRPMNSGTTCGDRHCRKMDRRKCGVQRSRSIPCNHDWQPILMNASACWRRSPTTCARPSRACVCVQS